MICDFSGLLSGKRPPFPSPLAGEGQGEGASHIEEDRFIFSLQPDVEAIDGFTILFFSSRDQRLTLILSLMEDSTGSVSFAARRQNRAAYRRAPAFHAQRR